MVTACSTGLLASVRRRSSAWSRGSDGDDAAATVMFALASLTQYRNRANRSLAGGNGMPSSRRSNNCSVAAISRRSRWAAARRLRSSLCSRSNATSSRLFPACAIARYLAASALRCAPTASPAAADAVGCPGDAGLAGTPLHPAASTPTTAAMVAAMAAQRRGPGLAMTASYCRPAGRTPCLVLRRHIIGAGVHRLARAVHLRRLVPGQLPAVDGDHGAGNERRLVRAEPEHGLRYLPGRAGPGHRRGHPRPPPGARGCGLEVGGQGPPPCHPAYPGGPVGAVRPR